LAALPFTGWVVESPEQLVEEVEELEPVEELAEVEEDEVGVGGKGSAGKDETAGHIVPWAVGVR
jgi:hypothetical protein